MCARSLCLDCGRWAGCYSLTRAELETVVLEAGGALADDVQAAASLGPGESLYILVDRNAPDEASELAVRAPTPPPPPPHSPLLGPIPWHHMPCNVCLQNIFAPFGE